MDKKYFQAEVKCLHCGHSWPQVLNKHLEEIECHKCEHHGVNVVFDSEIDLEKWQLNNSGFAEYYAEIEDAYFQRLEEEQREEIYISGQVEWTLFKDMDQTA